LRIKDFARIIGVSPATVSQAVNGTGRVSPVTREMVRRRMAELGYAPNPHARQLVTGRSGIVVLHHTNQDILTDLFLVELTRSIHGALHRHGYGLLIDAEGDFADTDYPLCSWITSRATDGVILLQGWSPVNEWIRQHASADMPIVVYGATDECQPPHTASVSVDFAPGIEQTARHLIGLGHRRFGYIGIGAGDRIGEWFAASVASMGGVLPSAAVIDAGFRPVDGAGAMRKILALPNPPTAVFCRKDDLALGAIGAAAREGIRVPEQLSIVGHDDVPISAVIDPPLTTVHLACDQLGRAIVDALQSLSRNPGVRVEPERIPTLLTIRSSTAAPPQPR